MIKPRTARFLKRGLRDIALGLMLFVALAGLGALSANSTIGNIICNSAQARSYPLGFGTPVTPIPGLQLVTVATPVADTSLPSMPLLAAVFALVVAFDLWFLRHLSRVYASTRLGGWRRG